MKVSRLGHNTREKKSRKGSAWRGTSWVDSGRHRQWWWRRDYVRVLSMYVRNGNDYVIQHSAQMAGEES